MGRRRDDKWRKKKSKIYIERKMWFKFIINCHICLLDTFIYYYYEDDSLKYFLPLGKRFILVVEKDYERYE